jgi:hypothetical protein
MRLLVPVLSVATLNLLIALISRPSGCPAAIAET